MMGSPDRRRTAAARNRRHRILRLPCYGPQSHRPRTYAAGQRADCKPPSLRPGLSCAGWSPAAIRCLPPVMTWSPGLNSPASRNSPSPQSKGVRPSFAIHRPRFRAPAMPSGSPGPFNCRFDDARPGVHRKHHVAGLQLFNRDFPARRAHPRSRRETPAAAPRPCCALPCHWRNTCSDGPSANYRRASERELSPGW